MMIQIQKILVMNKIKLALKHKNLFFLISLFLLFTSNLYADNWVIAGTKFQFLQNIDRYSSETKVQELLPQLIVEHISTDLIRRSKVPELVSRKEESLYNERLSLLLQLSKEMKSRDAIFLNPQNAKKKYAESDKKLKDLYKKIDDNLLETEKLKEKYRTEKNENAADENFVKKFTSAFKSFTSSFKAEDKDAINEKDEQIALYGTNENHLLALDELNNFNGTFSRAALKKILDKKINALVTGNIITYGRYASVSCDLYLFPEGKKIASVTEAGSLENLLLIASNISQKLVPAITNSLPLEIIFDIQPEEFKDKTKILVDGNLLESKVSSVMLDAGLHRFEFECKGFLSRSFSYVFEGNIKYSIKVPLVKENLKTIDYYFVNDFDGNVYVNGKHTDTFNEEVNSSSIQVNGFPVIGQFISSEKRFSEKEEITKDDDGNEVKKMVETEDPPLSFFFYIDPKVYESNSTFSVKSIPISSSEYIEKWRKRTYTAYTALVFSMPFILYANGQYETKSNALGMNENFWELAHYTTVGITSICTAWFLIDVIFYLRAANSVLPVNAKAVPQSLFMSEAKTASENQDNESANEEKSDTETTNEIKEVEK